MGTWALRVGSFSVASGQLSGGFGVVLRGLAGADPVARKQRGSAI